MNHPDDADDGDARHVTLGDALTRVRLMLSPQLYTDETSSVEELLQQQVIEQRAVRAWLVVCATLLATLTVLLFVVAAVAALAGAS